MGISFKVFSTVFVTIVLISVGLVAILPLRHNNPSVKSIAPTVSPSSIDPNNPIEMLAAGLPPNIIEKLKPLGEHRLLNNSDLNLIFSLLSLQGYANSSTVANALDAVLADGGVSDDEVAAFQDIDHDYVSNVLEIERYHTDPTKLDTSGLGIDDFNAIFTYNLNQNNKTQVQQFLETLPNVSARQWYIYLGGVGDTSNVVFVGTQTNETALGDNAIVEVSVRDPLIQYYAKHSSIVWDGSGKMGHLLVDGAPIWNSYDYGGYPSYYFTHGRVGRCGDTTLATMSILELMGYKTVEVKGTAPSNGTMEDHVWCETQINSKVYVVNYGELAPRDGFYQRNGWIISESSNYNPDWYDGASSDVPVLQTALVIGSSIAVAVVAVVYWKKRKRQPALRLHLARKQPPF